MARAGTAQERAQHRDAPSRIALDTSCVVNLLSLSEAPNPDLLRLVRLGHERRLRVIVTPIVGDEIPTPAEVEAGGAAPAGRQYIRQRLEMFAEEPISPERRAERDAMGKAFLELLWPNAQPGSRTWDHGRRDCLHLASLKLCGGGAFVTLDDKLRKKAQDHTTVLGCEVVFPDEVVARLPKARRLDPAAPDAVVRAARADDSDEVARLMEPIRSSYPMFDSWRAKALAEKDAYVGLFDGKVAGISVWSPKDDRVVKLSTFYVGDDYQGLGLGPHLLFHQLRLWVERRFEKVIVTVSSERLHVLDFFLAYGFRIEGASARRYKAGQTEFILAKHLYYEDVSDADLEAFLTRLSREVFSLADLEGVGRPERWFMPPIQRELRPTRGPRGVQCVSLFQGSDKLGDVSLNDLDEIVYPARLGLDGREAFLIPIQPSWANAMMEIPERQVGLFPNTDKLRLRTDNAYYCTPRLGEQRLTGSPVLFYVSSPKKAVAGFARIVACRIAPPEELHFEFGDIGIYKLADIMGHVTATGAGKYAGTAMALKFAWWVPLSSPVGLGQLKTEFGLSHPQTVTPIPFNTYTRIVRAGGIDW